jgi:MFS family permease
MYSTTSTTADKRPGILINSNYAWLWLGGTVSSFGDILYEYTLVVWITLFLGKNQPWTPLMVSGVLVASLGTAFLFGPIVGVFVDRANKRRTMLGMDALRAALVALLIPATNAFPLPFVPAGRLPLALQLAAIYVIVALATLSGQFFNPARTALIADIVPDTYRARAAGLGQASQSVALLVAPALAPVLAISVGVEWAIAANALSFVASFFTILQVNLPAQETSSGGEPGRRVGAGNTLRQFYAGIALVARNRILSTLVISVALVMLGAATINTLDIFFALHNLHAQPQLYGLLSTVMGTGVLAGSILAAALSERLGLVRVFSLSLLAAGALVVVYSRMTSLAPALVLVLVVGIAQAALNTVVAPLFLRVTPREYVGRVSAIVSSTAALAQLIGTMVTGFLAGQLLVDFHLELHGLAFGPFDTIIGGGGVIVVLGALYALLRLGEGRGATGTQNNVATQSTGSVSQVIPDPTPVG